MPSLSSEMEADAESRARSITSVRTSHPRPRSPFRPPDARKATTGPRAASEQPASSHKYSNSIHSAYTRSWCPAPTPSHFKLRPNLPSHKPPPDSLRLRPTPSLSCVLAAAQLDVVGSAVRALVERVSAQFLALNPSYPTPRPKSMAQ
ncbi:hypothetical protein M422DRAFT_266180 [Sphaerobolus stellatus SS14]|uniref:Uncharacterized protein n=1 Tax=Sphaerobolus stellatus (strain SS14) TaxID=990650 RepID=A0A0C9V3J5_SPHS4|nr:hypothetical protein M422DRAFT_266180 [Sphaerobolus stellatus SS14]